MPRDLGKPSARATSETGNRVYTGSGEGLLNYSNGVVDGDSLILTSTEDNIAWAMYKADGLLGLWVSTLGIETVPGGGDNEWYAALSNFTRGCWDWEIHSNLPEIDYDLTQYVDRIVSPLGNMYWVIAVPAGGYTLKILKSTIIAEATPDDPWKPGEGNFLCASQGLPGEIDLQWGGIDGAQGYELYRREAARECDPPTGGDFELLAVVPDTMYVDIDVVIGMPYEYKVRAVNDNGYGAFSEIAFGWAGEMGGNPPVDDASAMGVINDYPAESLTISDPCRGETFTFAKTVDTTYFDLAGEPVEEGYFAVGMTVFVSGVFAADGTRIANAVMEAYDPTDPPVDPVSFVGAIMALGDGQITLQDERGTAYTAVYDDATIWIDETGEVVDITSFAVGDIVCVSFDPKNPSTGAAKTVAKLPAQGPDPVDPMRPK